MKATFLQKILNFKKDRVEAQKRLVGFEQLRKDALRVRSTSKTHRLRKSLQNREGVNIIAEIKRASPSKGVIKDNIDVAFVAQTYESGGACAISVLTEEDFFNGSLDDLRAVRATTVLPVLRKDFIFGEFQVYEAAAAGADAVLLIAAMLDNKALEKLYCLAERELGLDALVEVHNHEELERAKRTGAKIIGVNNRDLYSFKTSLDVSRELIKYKPLNSLMISESGLHSHIEISKLRKLGFDGFLIGEALMRSGNPQKELEKLTVNN